MVNFVKSNPSGNEVRLMVQIILGINREHIDISVVTTSYTKSIFLHKPLKSVAYHARISFYIVIIEILVY